LNLFSGQIQWAGSWGSGGLLVLSRLVRLWLPYCWPSLALSRALWSAGILLRGLTLRGAELLFLLGDLRPLLLLSRFRLLFLSSWGRTSRLARRLPFWLGRCALLSLLLCSGLLCLRGRGLLGLRGLGTALSRRCSLRAGLRGSCPDTTTR
jgi:hypothetical protein